MPICSAGWVRRRNVQSDGVNLGHQGVVERRSARKILRVAVGKLRHSGNASIRWSQRHVLEREMVVQAGFAQAPVEVRPASRRGRIERNVSLVWGSMLSLPVLERAVFTDHARRAVAVNSEACPTSGFGIGEGLRPGAVVLLRGSGRDAAKPASLAAGQASPGGIGTSRNRRRVGRGVPLIEPVVGLELESRGGEQIEDRRRWKPSDTCSWSDEPSAGADQTRVDREMAPSTCGSTALSGIFAPEACSGLLKVKSGTRGWHAMVGFDRSVYWASSSRWTDNAPRTAPRAAGP